jgi:hypothetical protein
MKIEDKIWYDLVDTKFGDEYLILYLSRQRTIRKWFKISTIVLSAGGIFSAFQSLQIPTMIFCTVTGVMQILTSIENFIIHSEDDLDSLSNLRMKYYDRLTKLEILWHNLDSKKITEEQATDDFFNLRQSSSEIENIDNKLNIRSYNKLRYKADLKARDYLKTYYYE